MEPCKAPTLGSSAAKPECGCASATEPLPIVVEGRVPAFDEMRLAQTSSDGIPLALVLLVAGVAIFAYAGQRRGARLVLLHLARPEPEREKRRFRRPRLVLSDRERRAVASVRALFERGPTTAAVPIPAAAAVRRER